MEDKQMYMYNGMVYGVKVSEYGLEKGYLDYGSLAEIIGPCIFNGTVREATHCDWELVAGEWDEDEEVMSDYIISPNGAKFLKEYTDELVFYNETLDIYVWGVCHWGTSWNYELTNIKLEEE